MGKIARYLGITEIPYSDHVIMLDVVGVNALNTAVNKVQYESNRPTLKFDSVAKFLFQTIVNCTCLYYSHLCRIFLRYIHGAGAILSSLIQKDIHTINKFT